MSGWQPDHTVRIVAGTPPGGGLDRAARALLSAIEAERLLAVPAEVVNVPGDGARKAWATIDAARADAHVIAISSPNLTTDRLVGLAAFDQDSYTPLATLYTESIAFVVRADQPLDAAALLRRLAGPGPLTVALSTALGNPNHIALAQVVQAVGGDIGAPRIRVFDTALDAVADVIAGTADLAAVTAASAVAEMAAGRVRSVAVSAPQRLPEPFAAVPTWTELSVPCVIGAWRGVSGPAGIRPEAIAFWEGVLAQAVRSPVWAGELARHCWSPQFMSGAALRRHLAQERSEYATLLGQLGLLRTGA
jgi:putative tricarboxylic transport membrane protein